MAIKTNLISVGKVDLYWFSGTGNTLVAARAFADQMAKLNVEVRLRSLPCPPPRLYSPDSAIAVACPVHGLTVPALVQRWMEDLPETTAQTPAIAIITRGLMSGAAGLTMERLFTRKGFRPLALKEILMPSNLIVSAPNEINEYLAWRGQKKARFFAHAVAMQTAAWRRRLTARALMPLQKTFLAVGSAAARFIGARFRTNGKCNNCGLCEQMCPTRNIRDSFSGPEWGNRCMLCLRCLNFCPASAVKNSLHVFTLPRHRAPRIKPGDFLRPGRANTMFQPKTDKRTGTLTAALPGKEPQPHEQE